ESILNQINSVLELLKGLKQTSHIHRIILGLTAQKNAFEHSLAKADKPIKLSATEINLAEFIQATHLDDDATNKTPEKLTGRTLVLEEQYKVLQEHFDKKAATVAARAQNKKEAFQVFQELNPELHAYCLKQSQPVLVKVAVDKPVRGARKSLSFFDYYKSVEVRKAELKCKLLHVVHE